MKKLILSVLASVALAACSVAPVHSPEVQAEIDTIKEFSNLRQATWRIDMVTKFDDKVGSCSGTFIDRHYVLTAAHCDPNNDDINLMIGGKKAVIVKKDVSEDLMLLLVPVEGVEPVKVEHLVPGPDHKVVVVGYPFGVSQYITEGRVQGQVDAKDLASYGVTEHYLSVSAGISPGNSGGGVYAKNQFGEWVLIGVVSRGGGIVALIVHPDEVAKFVDGVTGPK